MARVIFLLTVQARVIFLLTEKIFQKSTNQKQELPVVAMFVKPVGAKLAIFIEDPPQMLPTKFRFIWPRGFRDEDF